jgi:predicted NBD/HSP70 family sugar kinase
MSSDFDPLELTIEASVNHVIIGDAGCPEIAGMRAEDVCSRNALHGLARDSGLQGLRRDRLLDDLGAAAASADARVSRCATAALVTFGRRIGALIATLRDPTTPPAGGSPWRRAYLSHWLTVDSVWLAGGLLAGRSSRTIMAGVQDGAAMTARPCRVALAPHPAVAPLLGAARRSGAASPAGAVVVADLGHTSIKTALVERSTAGLRGLRLLDACAPPSHRSPDDVEDTVAAALLAVVERADDIRSRGVRVIVSVACEVSAGIPVDNGQGVYGLLEQRVTSLRRGIADRTGADVTLEFINDGTAAAFAAGSANSATITAGTWLGVGFQPAQPPPLLDLALDLWVVRG